MATALLGISAFYHDSAAALLVDGRIAAAAQEERFTRRKHDASFPAGAVKSVFDESGADPSMLKAVVFYDKPFLKFERLLETYHAFAPRGLASFTGSIPVWIKEKLFLKRILRRELSGLGIAAATPLLFTEHHLSHAASAFFPSPFDEAAVLTIDGVGEWATAAIGLGRGSALTLLRELHFPHSIGLLYSAFTQFCGFRVNSGEYKLMGLAPYGIAGSERVATFRRLITENIADVRPDGSVILNMHYFNYATGLTMCNNRAWEKLFCLTARAPESALTQPYMDLALAIQQLTEDIVLRLAATARELTGCENLVMAGGVALNSVANGKLLKSGIFENIWIQPAAGDAGGALGAAFAAWHIHLGQARTAERPDSMQGAFLGPSFDNRSIEKLLVRHPVKAVRFDDFDPLARKVAMLLDQGKIIGWFQGRMEFGPRALGNRSILADARNPEMQKKLNLQVKFRESFRPLAPSVLAEDSAEFCERPVDSPYMSLVVPIAPARRRSPDAQEDLADPYARLYSLRSDIPAVTHLDYTARVQTVSRNSNERFWKLLTEFKNLTGYGILINTSFNVRGEPLVCNPEDALRCFMNTGIDYLVMNDFLIDKADMAPLAEEFKKGYEFALD
jgi:carbamoyltransferase